MTKLNKTKRYKKGDILICDDIALVCKKGFSVKLFYFGSEFEYIGVFFEPLNIESWTELDGHTNPNELASTEILEDIEFMWQDYALEDDENLGKGANNLKKKYLEYFEEK